MFATTFHCFLYFCLPKPGASLLTSKFFGQFASGHPLLPNRDTKCDLKCFQQTQLTLVKYSVRCCRGIISAFLTAQIMPVSALSICIALAFGATIPFSQLLVQYILKAIPVCFKLFPKFVDTYSAKHGYLFSLNLINKYLIINNLIVKI